MNSGDTSMAYLGQMTLDLAHRHAAGVHRDDPLVEAGKAALVLRDQLWLETTGAVARHIDAQRTFVGEHRLAAAAIAVVPAPAVGARQMDTQLGAQRAFDDGSLQLLEYGLDASGVHRAGDQLLKQVLGQDRFRRSRRRGLFARHGGLLNLVIVGPSHKNPDTLA